MTLKMHKLEQGTEVQGPTVRSSLLVWRGFRRPGDRDVAVLEDQVLDDNVYR